MAKISKKNSKKLTASALKTEVLKFLIERPKKQFTARQIAGILKIDNNKDSVEHALRQLEDMGAVAEVKEGRFAALYSDPANYAEVEDTSDDASLGFMEAAKEAATKYARRQAEKSERKTLKETSTDHKKPKTTAPKQYEGVVDMTRTGAAYIVVDSIESDVYVAPRNMQGALNGDTVVVEVFPPRPRRRRDEGPRRPEGTVLKVVKRSNEFFIGTLRKSRKYAILLPDNPNMPVDVLVPLDQCANARDGDKVVVRIVDWQEGRRNVPVGKVTQVLGAEGGNDFEMQKILINAGFELQHTEESMAEAAAIPDTISPQEIARRRDFRDILTFTIDPEDAKDFDDALSYRVLDNGHIEIGVHIADVTHFLKPDTPLDREAFKRSTSVYLVDRCLPMLPEKLSNNLCSLVPHQDRLTFSAVFTFDEKEQIVQRWFGKTVIHSAKRFTYEEAQTMIENKPADELKSNELFPALDEALGAMLRLSRSMRKDREKNGALSFETEEVRFKLDENGAPLHAYVKERKEAHMLIEDFMLLANKEVAIYIDQLGQAQKEVPFVYRVHDLPDLERVQEFARFAAEMGHPMKMDTPKQIAQSFNMLTKAARTNDALKLLEPMAIRTMAKAIYSTENIGHYGLGFSHYAHFTSPIRRYSDVLAHRILEANLGGRIERMDKAKLDEKCKHISGQEKKAADAERESVKLKQTELMSKHIGEVFAGRVSGMVDRGFFVQLDGSQAEGLVDFRYLRDSYILDSSRMKAIGRHFGHIIKMGDRVEVRIIAADPQRRQIDMELLED
jgi:ribonuclease R